MNDSITLIVFDWDGTLMDSQSRIVASMQAAAVEADLPVPGQAQVRDVIGLGLGECLGLLFPDAGPADIARVAEAYRQQFWHRCREPEALYPGVRETLDWLRSRSYELAVATGKSRAGLNRALRSTGLGDLMAASRCADEAPSKPHPRMLLEIMEVLGHAPDRTLVIGDTEYDLRMARNAGAHGVGVTCGAHPAERLQQQGPLACVSDVTVLPTLLRDLGYGDSRAEQAGGSPGSAG